jgi:hypothetical protein
VPSLRTIRRSHGLGLLVTALGVLLFVQTVRRAGFDSILDGLGRAGIGFLLILALSAVRHVVRALAWTWCVDPPARLPLSDAFVAHVTGDALGNITPLGIAISEPAKAMWVRRKVSLVAGGAALTIENVIYSVSVLPIFLAGTLALPFAFESSPVIRWTSVAMLVACSVALAIVVVALLRKSRAASDSLAWVADRGILSQAIGPRLAAVREAEDLIHRFSDRGARRLARVALLDAIYHASAIAEVYVTLLLLALPVTLLTAFILEYVNRVITVAFKFMPMRLGVDEAGSGLAAGLLHLGAANGVTLAIIRKGRVLCWTVLGLVFLATRSVGATSAPPPPGEAREGERASGLPLKPTQGPAGR